MKRAKTTPSGAGAQGMGRNMFSSLASEEEDSDREFWDESGGHGDATSAVVDSDVESAMRDWERYTWREGKVSLGEDARSAVVCMDRGEHFRFVGSVRVRVVKGCVIIGGLSLRCRCVNGEEGREVTVHAPLWEGAMELRVPTGSGGSAVDARTAVSVGGVEYGEGYPVVLHMTSLPESTPMLMSAAQDATDARQMWLREYSGGSGKYQTHLTSVVRLAGCFVVPSPMKRAVNFHRIPEQWELAVDCMLGEGDGSRKLNRASSAASLRNTIAGGGSGGGGVRVMICGGKGLGKSTLGRYVVNRVLSGSSDSGLFFLDGDVGQPEFTPPGVMALHRLRGVEDAVLSPPFMHLRSDSAAVAAHFVGATSSKFDPPLYIQRLESLVQRYYTEVGATAARARAPPPLVVNCDGWVKGLGAGILAEVMRCVQPTHILHVCRPPAPGSSRATVKYPTLPSAYTLFPPAPPAAHSGPFDTSPRGDAKVLHVKPWALRREVASGTGDAAKSSLLVNKVPAHELRGLRLVFYFLAGALKKEGGRERAPLPPSPVLSAVLKNGVLVDSECSVAASLQAATPYVVPWSEVQMRSMADPQISGTELLHLCNGSLVALMREGDIVGTGADSALLGLGIVRSIDPEMGLLYILSPLPLDVVATCNAVACPGSSSGLHLPLSMVFDPSSSGFPYLAAESIISGTSTAMKSRNGIVKPWQARGRGQKRKTG